MYISAVRESDQVLVWERGPDHKRVIKEYPAPLYFYIEDKANGDYKSIHGKKLSRFEFDSWTDLSNARQAATSRGRLLYESDIPPEIKTLSQHYQNCELPTLHTTFLDIEVDYDPEIGFSSVANPYAPINAIAIHHYWSKRSVVYVVPPPGWVATTFDESLRELSEVVFCEDEAELLRYTIMEFEDSDVLSGWNSNFFDMPYIGKRVEMVLGSKWFNKLSFGRAMKPKYDDVEIFGTIQTTLRIYGRISADYMDLFKKYQMEQRRSYKLEFIADEILPHLPKLKYEGTLAGLYKNDFNTFVRYNIRDTEILAGFEDELGYVMLGMTMCHTSTCLFKEVFGTLKLTDMAIVNYCHEHLDLIVPDWSQQDDGSIQGAYVLYPQIGLHDYIGSIDINSLYPSAIRSINISPETYIGQFSNNVADWESMYMNVDCMLTFKHENGVVETKHQRVWKEWMLDNMYAISGYGTVYDQKKQGVLPAILERWYGQRKGYQKQAKGFFAQAGDVSLTAEERLALHEKSLDPAYSDEDRKKFREKVGQLDLSDADREEADKQARYFDRLQYVYKIKLNSAYGALSNAFYRFYRLSDAASTTGTGRAILRHQVRKVAEVLDGDYWINPPLDETPEDPDDWGDEILFEDEEDSGILARASSHGHPSPSIVYGDTDSVYFKLSAATNTQEAIELADSVAEQVNASFPQFMRDAFLCTDGYDTIIKAAREAVSDRSIFIKKKKYILHLVDLDGKAVDKLKIMGVEMRKTTTPRPIQIFLQEIVTVLLKDQPWREIEETIVNFRDKVRDQMDVFDIGLPKTVKKVEHYTAELAMNKKARVPGHVMATICYNTKLVEYNDLVSPAINSNTKIKVFYLMEPEGRFKAIALPTDIEDIPQWFLDDIKVDRRLHSQKLIDANLQIIFNAIDKRVPTRMSMEFDDLFG